MKCLYVSDLDGTLLRSDEKTSVFTNTVINELVSKGMIFSYATARSYNTAKKVTGGIDAKFPLIVYNGALIIDNNSGKIMISNFFDKVEFHNILDELISNDIYPIVYSFINNQEKFSYVEKFNTIEMTEFISTRKNDERNNPLLSLNDLYMGECFYITCIDKKHKLEPLYEKYKNIYPIVFHEDIYLHSQWLEIMPKNASKSNAAKQLKDYLKCEKLVVFGDGENDVNLFLIADEAYAVSNAAESLKHIATDVIGSNNDDAVARWLLENFKVEKK